MNKKAFSIRSLCLIAMCTAATIVFAQVRIPMPGGVPITMQTFALALTAVILGAKRGTISALTYVLLALVGLPVLSGFGGGLGSFINPTGGFTLMFPVLALMTGLGADFREKRGKTGWLIAGIVIGNALLFAWGMIHFSIVTQNNLHTAFFATVLPFIPGDVLKMILAVILGTRIRRILAQQEIKG